MIDFLEELALFVEREIPYVLVLLIPVVAIVYLFMLPIVLFVWVCRNLADIIDE